VEWQLKGTEGFNFNPSVPFFSLQIFHSAFSLPLLELLVHETPNNTQQTGGQDAINGESISHLLHQPLVGDGAARPGWRRHDVQCENNGVGILFSWPGALTPFFATGRERVSPGSLVMYPFVSRL